MNLDPESDRLYYKTYVTRPLHTIDNYKPYYLDPDYGFESYWDIYPYNQHTLCFHNTFEKHDNQIVPDSHDIDKAMNSTLSNALVDQWQTNRASVNLLTQEDPQDDFTHEGPQVSLTTEVEARFVTHKS